MTLPVTVSRTDPNHLRVEEAEIPDWRDAGMNQAEQIAASMQSGTSAAPGFGSQIIDLSGDPGAAAQKIAMAEQATGMDLNADGKIGAAPAGAAGTPPPGEATDRIEGLERLAKLYESGALSRRGIRGREGEVPRHLRGPAPRAGEFDAALRGGAIGRGR